MSGRRLAVFDVDGTLTRTNLVDETCYEVAIREVWGIADVCTDWGTYQHSTDNAIAEEISLRHRGRPATASELEEVRARFLLLLEERWRIDPDLFRPLPGAAEALAELPEQGWTVAIATGGWTQSARFKLERAGLPHAGVPAAFACDARPREEIIQIAVRRAEALTPGAFDSVVYVGDGAWDVRASRRVGVGFVGIGERLDALRNAGASEVLADYGDLRAFVASLESAAASMGTLA